MSGENSGRMSNVKTEKPFCSSTVAADFKPEHKRGWRLRMLTVDSVAGVGCWRVTTTSVVLAQATKIKWADIADGAREGNAMHFDPASTSTMCQRVSSQGTPQPTRLRFVDVLPESASQCFAEGRGGWGDARLLQ